MTVVRVAFTQATWTGDKESMIKVHEDYTRDAAAQGAKVVCFQELFYGPYFWVQDPQYYSYAESIPGATTERFQALAKELGIVMVLPVYEEEQPGVLYNTAAVVDADGRYLGKYRKHHIPHATRLLGEVLLPARQPRATRSSTPPSARSASTSATTGTSPRAGAPWDSTAPRSSSTRRDVAPACRTISGSSSSRRTRWPTSTSSARSTGSARGQRSATTTSTARRTSSTLRARSSTRWARRPARAGRP